MLSAREFGIAEMIAPDFEAGLLVAAALGFYQPEVTA
jgi:hypothetical protein